MKQAFKGSSLLFFAFCLVSALVTGIFSAQAEGERRDGFYRLVTQEGKNILETAQALVAGDIFIDSNNNKYAVTKISGDIAQVKFLGKEKLPAPVGVRPPGLAGGLGYYLRMGLARLGLVAGPQNRQVSKMGPIGIYHTHSDESYVPTSGTASKPWGDVYQVGKTLKEALEGKGVKVDWSRNNHNPHDAMAYKRSRATVFELLKSRPAALIDIHRDSVPPGPYQDTIRGEPATKVMMVVGRQNQNRGANLEFAKAIKANADARIPGNVKGILISHGNYNQDLGPRTILLEFGTDKNSLAMAETAARHWADVLSAAVYGVSGGAAPQQASRQNVAQGNSALRAIIWVVALVVVGGILYLVVSSGGWGKMWQRLRNTGREFAELGGDEKEDEK